MSAIRHAVVTGGSRGIGLAIARQLLQQGLRVTLVARSAQSLARATAELTDSVGAPVEGVPAAGPSAMGQPLMGQPTMGQPAMDQPMMGQPDTSLSDRLFGVEADVSDRASVLRAFDAARGRHGAIDILVNNAGQAQSQRFDRTDAQTWQTMLEVNLGGVFHCTQAALGDMIERKWGRIVNVASTAGLTGYAYVSAYCAAKHGVVGLTRALAQEVAAQGVTVNAICPGFTETDIVRAAVQNITSKTGQSSEQAQASLMRHNPQGRLVQPEEVAAMVVWLCQPQAASINGQTIAVDGGELAGSR